MFKIILEIEKLKFAFVYLSFAIQAIISYLDENMEPTTNRTMANSIQSYCHNQVDELSKIDQTNSFAYQRLTSTYYMLEFVGNRCESKEGTVVVFQILNVNLH